VRRIKQNARKGRSVRANRRKTLVLPFLRAAQEITCRRSSVALSDFLEIFMSFVFLRFKHDVCVH